MFSPDASRLSGEGSGARGRRFIKSSPPSEPEKAQIAIEGTDDLYWEIRIENSLTDENGEEVRLKKGAEVEVTVETDRDATTPKHVGDDDSVRRSQLRQAGDRNVGKVCAVWYRHPIVCETITQGFRRCLIAKREALARSTLRFEGRFAGFLLIC